MPRDRFHVTIIDIMGIMHDLLNILRSDAIRLQGS